MKVFGGRRLKLSLIAILGVSILIHFNNCSDVEFSGASSKVGGGPNDPRLGNPDPLPPDPPIPPNPTPPEVIDQACIAKPNKSKTVNVVFEDPRIENNDPNFTCAFGVGGNLNRRQAYFQARNEQAVNFSLPQGSVICDMNFTAPPNQPMEFDDHFMINFDSFVLAASDNQITNDYLADVDGIPFFRWNDLVGQRSDNIGGGETPFCLGANQDLSSCSWPGTEQVGQMNLNFDSRVIRSIIAKDVNRTDHKFSFVMVGDDNDEDCQHKRVQFSVQITYVE